MSEFDRLDPALEELLSDRSPRTQAEALTDEEQQMLQMAQLLRGNRREPAGPQFVNRLHDRLFPAQRKVTRRAAFFSGAGALAAGIIAGFGIDRAATSGSPAASGAWRGSLVPASKGQWLHVASVADVPDGAVRAFTAGSVQGFLLNKGGEYRALSRICTHMGCSLLFAPSEQNFVCPCHGAQFDLRGQLRSGPGGYYGHQLPPLPKVWVRVRGNSIQVFSV